METVRMKLVSLRILFVIILNIINNQVFADTSTTLSSSSLLTTESSLLKTNTLSVWDVDGNGTTKPFSDALLAVRYLFGFRGDKLLNEAIESTAIRKTANEIETYLKDNLNYFDIDGDGETKPLTDGLLLIRYLLGFTGTALTDRAIGTNATRKISANIIAYIDKSSHLSNDPSTLITVVNPLLLSCIRSELAIHETEIPTSEQLRGLTSLSCERKKLTNSDIVELKNLVNLASLSLGENNISDVRV